MPIFSSGSGSSSASNGPALISKNVEEALLSTQIVSLSGDIYRVVFGKKKTITEVYDGKPTQFPDTMVLYAKEHTAGEDLVKHTVKSIEVEGPSDIDNKKYMDDKPAGKSYLYYSTYELESQTFNFQVVPTLNKGVKLLRTYMVPNKLTVLDGRVEEGIVMKDQDRSNFVSSGVDYRTGLLKHKIASSTQLELTL